MPYIFAYGSLVNELTWAEKSPLVKAEISGWMRQWRHCLQTPFGSVCALTVTPKDNIKIQGLLINVHELHLSELDKREIGYHRELILNVTSEQDITSPVYMYTSQAQNLTWACEESPILQSYVDCIADGYARNFGESGLRNFFKTTKGWDLPILNDRDNPKYPRAMKFTPKFYDKVDALLKETLSTPPRSH